MALVGRADAGATSAQSTSAQSTSAQSTSAQSTAALLALEAALPGLARVRSEPEITHRIPGQDTHERRDLARGPTLILADRARPGPTGLAHLVAAIAAGCPTLVVAPPEAQSGWLTVLACVRAAGIDATRCDVVPARDATEAAAWIGVPSVATVVIDGPRTPWSAALGAALGDRRRPVALPHVWCALDGPDLQDGPALLLRHLLVRTVAVNTMRHGAPLSLDG